jgi:hypothetical protein
MASRWARRIAALTLRVHRFRAILVRLRRLEAMSLPYKVSACFIVLLAASPAFGQVLPNSIDCAAWEKQPNGSSYKAINDTEIKMANGATMKIGKDVVAEKEGEYSVYPAIANKCH